MSDEIKLSEELAACEARLAAQAPPPPAVNRDRLMYQAGWAACEVQLGREAVTPSMAPGRVFATAWSVASTAIAASLAVIVAMQWRPAAEQERVAKLEKPAAEAGARIDDGGRAPRVEVWSSLPMSAAKARSLDSSLLTLRRQALMNIWPEAVRVSAVSSSSAQPALKTSRELMQELLPAESAGSIHVLPPDSHRMGESI